MDVYEIDPTRDERWEELVQNHSQASVFHTRAWLDALARTYRYTPVAFTTSPPGCPLTNGIPFCAINGFFGRRRLVSLPFSDHCQPLVESEEQSKRLLSHLQQKREAEGWDYVELRPKTGELAGGGEFQSNQGFVFHELDLRHNLDAILQNTHKDCIQRKLRRAERENLVCEEGTTDSLLRKFYQLLLITRRRHGLPTQPVEWFRNLIACLGERLTIRVAYKNGCPIASILTLRHKQVMVFKYGCADHNLYKLGGMQFLLWRAIENAKNKWLSQFDLGRCDSGDTGLIAFKDRWGATRTELVYLRCGRRSSRRLAQTQQLGISKYICSHTPDSVLTAAGRVFYRHLG